MPRLDENKNTITPVIDQQACQVLDGIFKALSVVVQQQSKEQAKNKTDAATEAINKLIAQQDSNNKISHEEYNENIKNSRAIQEALRTLSSNQNKSNQDAENNNRAVHEAIKGIINEQKKNNENSRAANAALAYNRKRDEIEGLENQKRSRAENAALQGKFDDNTKKLNDTLSKIKDALSPILDAIKQSFKQALASYDELTRELRKTSMTTANIAALNQKSSSTFTFLNKNGIKVDKNDINDTLIDLKSSNYSDATIKNMDDEMLATIALLKKQYNITAQEAASIARANKGNLKAVRDLAIQNRDVGSEWMNSFMKTLSSDSMNRALGNDINKIAAIQNSFKETGAVLGEYLHDSEAITKIMQNSVLISNGQIEKNDLNTLYTQLGIAPETLKDPTALAQELEKRITSVKTKEDYERAKAELQALSTTQQQEGQALITALQEAMYDNMKGDYEKQILSSEQENIEGFNQNVAGGKIGYAITSFINKFDDGTGLISKFSANLNEWFGDSLSTEDGLKVIIGLLSTIVASKFIKDGAGFLKDGITSGLGKVGIKPGAEKLGSIAKIGGKALKGAGAVGLVVGAVELGAYAEENLKPEYGENWHEKISENISNEISAFIEELPEYLAKALPGVGKIAMFVTELPGTIMEGIVNGLFGLLPDSIKNSKTVENIKEVAHKIFNPISSIVEDLQENVFSAENYKYIFEDVPKFWDDFADSIPGRLENVGNSISEAWDDFIDDTEKWWKEIKDNFLNYFKDFGSGILKTLEDIPVIGNLFKGETNTNIDIDSIAKDPAYAAKGIPEIFKLGFEFWKNKLPAFGKGGEVNKPTIAQIAEKGPEAVIPLSDKESAVNAVKTFGSKAKNLLTAALSAAGQQFSKNNDAETVIESALDKLPRNGVPGDDPATIEKILSYAGINRELVYNLLLHGKGNKYKNAFEQRKKWYDEALKNAANQEGRDEIRGTYAERALEYGVSQLGKPYILRSLGKIGYVCNELVNACVKASGFDMKKFAFHTVKSTYANLLTKKYSDGNEYPDFQILPDVTPQTAKPGMIFFQDSRKNKEGGFQPGHVGLVYYGHQKLHSSGGSARYEKDTFLPNWQTPCRGVTVTPFDGNDYVFGMFPGLFETASGEFKLPEIATATDTASLNTGNMETGGLNSSNLGILSISGTDLAGNHFRIGNAASEEEAVENMKNSAAVVEQRKLAQSAIAALISKEIPAVRAAAKPYVDQAKAMINSENSKEILAALSSVIRYLRTIADSKKMPSPSKPKVSNY